MSTSDYKRAVEIIPTCVPQTLVDVQRHVNTWRGIAPTVHIDIDDGIYTPDFSWPYIEKGTVGEIEKGIFDDVRGEAHLMVLDSFDVGTRLIEGACNRIVVHVESFYRDNESVPFSAVEHIIHTWQSAGVHEIGLAICLDTHIVRMEPFISLCDYVTVMSVATIGEQGALYDSRAVSRIAELQSVYPELIIEVDGGVSYENIATLAQAGGRRFAVGSAISRAENPVAEYLRLKSVAENALP